MKKLLMTAAALLLIGAGCSGQTSGNVDVTVPEGGGTINVGGSGSGDGGSAGGGASGGYNY